MELSYAAWKGAVVFAGLLTYGVLVFGARSEENFIRSNEVESTRFGQQYCSHYKQSTPQTPNRMLQILNSTEPYPLDS